MRFENLGQGFVPKNLGEVKNRDLSFPFSPVKLSSGVVYGKVVSKSIATAEMVYFHDRHASAYRRVIENKSHREFEAVLS